jgi:hypothetical protein
VPIYTKGMREMSLARDWRRLMTRGSAAVVLALAVPITLAGLIQLGGQAGRVTAGLSAVLQGPEPIASGVQRSGRVGSSRRALAGAAARSARRGAGRRRTTGAGGGSGGRTRGGGGGTNGGGGGTNGGGGNGGGGTGGSGGGAGGGSSGGTQRNAGPVESATRPLRPVTQPAVPGVTDELQVGLEETGRSVDEVLSLGPP